LKNIFMASEIIVSEVVVLATGGTIAGTATSSSEHTSYTAAQIGVTALLQGVPGLQDALSGADLHSEQVAQLDSKDMDFATMLRLAQRCVHYLALSQVKGIVITHGTDTLEETAYFLHRVIPPELQTKPIVLTCAMRPATSSEADGPRNLRDAVTLARDAKNEGKARGVLAVCAGDVHHALCVQKVHTYALNAFSSGDTALGEPGVMARVDAGRVQWADQWVDQQVKQADFYIKNMPSPPAVYRKFAINSIVNDAFLVIRWPRVEMVLNHAHASGSMVRALLVSSAQDDPLQGIVVAGTGNGTVSDTLQTALQEAQSQGVEVVITSRCTWGGVRGDVRGGIYGGRSLSAVKTRVELVLKLLAAN
jgi:L-asparaginase